MYSINIKPSCQRAIDKLCKKNSLLKKALERKINEIIKEPQHYKPLRHDLAGERRVHILKSFVLRFVISEKESTVELISFDHHDGAYKRR